MTKPLLPEHKTAYRAWCTLIVQEWNKCSTWGRLLSKAQAQNLPVNDLPTTIDGFVHYKTPLRAVIAERLPALSKKLFDANDEVDRGMVLLWLMRNPQVATAASKATSSPFSEVAKEVKHNQHVIQANDMTHAAVRGTSNAGGHIPVRGRQARGRFPGR